jgi:hypothetical protein
MMIISEIDVIITILFVIFVIEPPLRLFQIVDEPLVTYPFVLHDKCFKILPEVPYGAALGREF